MLLAPTPGFFFFFLAYTISWISFHIDTNLSHSFLFLLSTSQTLIDLGSYSSSGALGKSLPLSSHLLH